MPKISDMVPRNPNVVEFGLMATDGATPATWLTLVPKDSVSVTDSQGTQTYSDFSSALGKLAQIAPDGDRTVSISFAAYLVPSDVAFTTGYEAYSKQKPIAFRENALPRKGGAPWRITYGGFMTNFQRNYPKDGAAEVNVTLSASEIISEPGTTTP